MSLPVAALELMLEKGLSLADVVEIARVLAAGEVKPLSAGARRTRAYRERKANGEAGNVTSDVTVTRDSDIKKVSPTPPSKNKPTVPLKGNCPSVTPIEFEQWWSAYPKRVAKGQARKAYSAALRKTSAETLLIALEAASFPAELRFVPNPATWLNGECWLDGTGAPMPQDPPPDDDPWPRRIREFERNGFWNTTDWGPKPGRPDCQAPQSLLERAA